MISEQRFRIKKNGAPNFCCYCTRPELIENYDLAIADKTQTWECHHKMEKYFPAETLKAIGWYYDCEPNELIFITKDEHRKLYHKTFSEEHKRNLSKSHKGQKAWNKGKTYSDEYKKKLSDSHKGYKASEEARRKMSDAQKRRWAIKKDKDN